MAGADEIYELAQDFGKASSKVASALYDTYKQEGETFAEDWRQNARETSDADHLKHLPNAITADTRIALGISVEVGPEVGRRQGALGRIDELGSATSPPHFNGLRAMGAAEKRLERAADATIGFLVP